MDTMLLKDGRLTLRLGNCGQLTQLLLSQFDAMNSCSSTTTGGKHHQRAFVSPSALFNDVCSRLVSQSKIIPLKQHYLV